MQVTILSLARISFVSGSACQPSRRKKVRHRDCQKSALSHNIKTHQTLTMRAKFGAKRQLFEAQLPSAI